MLEFHEAGDPDVNRTGNYHFSTPYFIHDQTDMIHHSRKASRSNLGKVNSETAAEMNEQAKK
jgi:hypothetical protein